MKYRVFYPENDAGKLPAGVTVEEQYHAFGIVNAEPDVIDALRKRYPVEDITAPKSAPTLTEVAGIAAAVERSNTKGPYILVVRFRAPVRQTWIDEIATTDCTYLEPIGSSTVVVRCANKRYRTKLKKLSSVMQVQNYVPDIQITADFFDHLSVAIDETALAAALEALGNTANIGEPTNIGGLTLPGVLLASFFTATDQQSAIRSLGWQGVRQISTVNATDLIIDLTAAKAPIDAILAIAQRIGLRSLRPKAVDVTYNELSRLVIADHIVTTTPPDLGLTGAGEIVAVADTGLDTGEAATLHLDFQGRLRHIRSFPFSASWKLRVKNATEDDGAADQFSGHGTHVCGSIIGNGERAAQLGLKPLIQGTAPSAELVFQAIEQKVQWNPQGNFFWVSHGKPPPTHGLFGIPDDLHDLLGAAYDQGARIHSNSWGGGILGTYDGNSRNLDDFVWKRKDLLVIVAAGNEAVKDSAKPALQSVTSPGTAKNCLTVGACETMRNGGVPDRLAKFSGRGPCTTGRRKPDVVAPGVSILSTRSSQIPANEFGHGQFPDAKKDYMFMGGTSMATPLVAGCAAVVRQYLRQFKAIANPTAALLKATLIHAAQYHKWQGAHDSSTPWADNEQGWGRIDLQRVLKPVAPTTVHFIDDQTGLATGDERLYHLTVTDNTVPLRMTLVYSDVAGQDLINNLNLFANDPSGSFLVGNDFQQTGVPDGANNVEGIIVEQPQIGNWTVRVVASNIPQGPQDFAIVISGGVQVV